MEQNSDGVLRLRRRRFLILKQAGKGGSLGGNQGFSQSAEYRDGPIIPFKK
jgi:hypothetical protein